MGQESLRANELLPLLSSVSTILARNNFPCFLQGPLSSLMASSMVGIASVPDVLPYALLSDFGDGVTAATIGTMFPIAAPGCEGDFCSWGPFG